MQQEKVSFEEGLEGVNTPTQGLHVDGFSQDTGGTRDMTRGAKRWEWAIAVVALAALTACEEVERVQDRFRDMTPYEAYEASLADAGLVETALGRDWITAGREAVESPASVSLPFHEEGFISSVRRIPVRWRIASRSHVVSGSRPK